MSAFITIRLDKDPGAVFDRLETPPSACDHRIPFGTCSLLSGNRASSQLLHQLVAGWQFDMWVYTMQCDADTGLRIETTENRVFFVYSLLGESQLVNPSDGRPHALSASLCTAIYVPAGHYLATLTAKQNTAFGFSIPYGYLVWFARYHPELLPLAEHWKHIPNTPFALPCLKVDKPVMRAFAQVKACPKRGAELDGALKIYVARFIGLYADGLRDATAQVPVAPAFMMDMVAAYLQDHFAETDLVTLSALASRFAMSETHLRRSFQEAHGVSIGEYTQALRVAAGTELLLTTNLPLQEIALKIGYEYAGSFNKAFQKQFGMSAGSYRLKHRR